ncbi:Rv2175c family DNA-binding protein [Timonella sp. A28]|uniref:Rv2175c family DNA-binding protein n=1 Tax=Timonella sp. A28 TaxID=3442640 RepID=UPI003EBAD778
MNVQQENVAERLETLVDEWLTQPEFAERLGTEVKSVRSALADQRILGVKRGQPKVLCVPAAFLIPAHLANPADAQKDDGSGKLIILPSLRGTIIQLKDMQLSDAEVLHWLFSVEESLGERPLDALLVGNRSAVRRAAQHLL